MKASGMKKEVLREEEKKYVPRVSTAADIINCYNCKLKGHIAKNCPSPRREIRCFLCKQIGHIASRCMSGRKVSERKKSNDVKTAEGYVNAIRSEYREKDLEKFIREIQIGKAKLCAQIDPGPSVCTIRASVVLNENWPLTRIK